ncbi:MAG: hypothetical protein KC731_30760 [Myxococcales bacterium]|nr:hypothetical protein [Myxococcales bacterium]
MDATRALARLAQLGRAVGAETRDVTAALRALRELLREARVEHRLVGGLAVLHHGYPRLTEDIEALVEAGGVARLKGLLELKLHAGRKQDEADAVALLKHLDERRYLALEAELPAALRPKLHLLRRDALEELAWEQPEG